MATELLRALHELDWEVVIQTRFPSRVEWMASEFISPTTTVLGVVTVGLEGDWELFERGVTENPLSRLSTLQRLAKRGVRVGVNGEPFVPGYHTEEDFRVLMKLLPEYGIYRYNLYNLHMNDWVAKEIHELGLDIEKIWTANQDRQWREVLKRLLDIADEEGIIIGCPDFVNSGSSRVEKANTCCGIDVDNPCTYNTHYWKKYAQEGLSVKGIVEKTWEGIGDKDKGSQLIMGRSNENYTLRDAGLKIEDD